MHRLRRTTSLGYALVLATCLLQAGSCFAQAPDSAAPTYSLQGPTIQASRLQTHAPGLQITTLDSLTRAAFASTDLASLLQQASSTNLRISGPTGVATPGLRGLGSQHTGVLWNGFVINSAQLATVDLRLMPAGLFGDVSITEGGTASLYGSGFAGGTINLSGLGKPKQGLGLQLGGSAGSFNSFVGWLGLSYGTARLQSSTRILASNSLNDFSFTDPFLPGQPERTLQHAATQQRGLMHSTSYTTGRHKVEGHAWYQFSERRLPGNLGTTQPGVARQWDEALRLTAAYHYTTSALHLTGRVAWMKEYINFDLNDRDSLAGSLSPLRSLLAEAQADWQLSERWLLTTGLYQAHYQAAADGYPQGEQQQRTAAFTALRYQAPQDRWQVSLSTRQAWRDGQAAPLTPSLSGRYQLGTRFTLRAHASRLYRLPTLNELHWNGGNPDLQPEEGWTSEAGLDFVSYRKRLRLAITGFSHWVQNWIVWNPSFGSTFAPENLPTVRSLGGSFSLNSTLPLGATTQLQPQLSYTYTSTRQQDATDPMVDGRPVPYAPEHRLWARLAFAYKPAQGLQGRLWVGSSHTGTQESPSGVLLDAYTLLDAGLNLGQALGKHALNLSLLANNLLNTTYRTVPLLPMPGRSLRLQLTYTFN